MEAQSQQRVRYGAHVVVDTLVDLGVTIFFANPGTSEIHLVDAIDANPGARPVLCLFEGVATGAADGYARVAGRPAAVLLHLGPGLANGLANLHNAYKARSPMIVLVGEHATDHLSFDTPLQSDLPSIAGYAAKAVFRLTPDADLQETIQHAVKTSLTAPFGPVVLLANADVMWGIPPDSAGTHHADPPRAVAQCDASLNAPDAHLIEQALAMLGNGGKCALILGDDALSSAAISLADRLSQATGCRLFCETFNARHERGAGIPAVERLPYFRELAQAKLAEYSHILLVGSRPPVAFFASPGQPSELAAPGSQLLQVPHDVSSLQVLEQLARRLGPPSRCRAAERVVPAEPAGSLGPRAIWAAIGRHLPPGAIVSDEAGVTSVGADAVLQAANSHLWLNLTGGSIGLGLPLATGAAIASPLSTVIAVHGDGGAMYTMQALWTQVREKARVVNIIFKNECYGILEHELKRHGLGPLERKGASMFQLTNPSIDWVTIAASMGMRSQSVATAEAFSGALRQGIAASDPCLIEVVLGAR